MLKCLMLAALLTVAAAMPGVGKASAQLIMLEEDGCPWCDRWNEEIGAVYSKTPEGQQAPLRRLDIHKRLPEDLRFLNKGRFTPTFILVADGREVGRIRGYPGEHFFWGYLSQLLGKVATKQTY